MNRYLLLLALTLLSTATAKAFDYKRYARLINNAELALIDGAYSKALSFYDSAFVTKDVPFVQDVYNASVCAVKASLNSRAMTYCSRLANMGVGKQLFTAANVYHKLFTSDAWEPTLQRAQMVRDSILNKKKVILHQIDSLVYRDQEYNRAWRNSGMAAAERDAMYRANDTISRALLDIFEREGFLGEGRIGPHLEPNGLFSYNLPFDVILIHNYQNRENGDSLFNTILKKAVEQGEVPPQYYAGISDKGTNMGTRPYYGEVHFFVQYKCKIYLDNYNQENRAMVDKSRAALGLCSTADLLKKVIYRTANPNSDFKISATLSIRGSFADKQSEEMILRESTVVYDTIPACKEM